MSFSFPLGSIKYFWVWTELEWKKKKKKEKTRQVFTSSNKGEVISQETIKKKNDREMSNLNFKIQYKKK